MQLLLPKRIGKTAVIERIDPAKDGQNAVVVGVSNIVGRPMSLELLLTGATATNFEYRSRRLPASCSAAAELWSPT